jgi:hypothetical protein
MTMPSFGITVMPEYFQSEGVDAVLDSLIDGAGATAVTTSPYVVAQADAATGSREPPGDAGAGDKRLLDRPLWGKREVYMMTAPSFTPTQTLYRNTPYQPPAANPLSTAEGPVVGAFLQRAKQRGLNTWLQIMAAIPPCYRVQFGGPLVNDQPLLPDGTPLTGRVDNNATLASSDVRSYLRALITDLCRYYPEADGLKFDWPEYPPYHFESLLLDFNPQVAPYAARLGLDLAQVARGVGEFLDDLRRHAHRLDSIDLTNAEEFFSTLAAAYPAMADMLRIRTGLVEDYAGFLYETVAEASGGSKKVFLQTFPPPLNRLSGFDFARLAPYANSIGVKFYTMHWPMMERHYAQSLLQLTRFSPQSVVAVMTALLNFSSDAHRPFASIRYPGPDEPHRIDAGLIAAKMAQVRSSLEQHLVALCAIAHAYGPEDDVVSRFRATLAAADGQIELNRYGYLSDAKLQALGRVFRAQSN